MNLKHSFLALTSLFLLGTVSLAYGMEDKENNENSKIHVKLIKDKEFDELNKLYKLNTEQLDKEMEKEDKILLLLEKKEKAQEKMISLCFGEEKINFQLEKNKNNQFNLFESIDENSQNNGISFNRKRKSIEKSVEINNTNQKKPAIEIQKKSSPSKDNGQIEFEQGKEAFEQKKLEKAHELYQLSAKKGHRYAKLYLGKSYLFGDGVDENEEEGIKWIREAAENGLPAAQFQLGQQYRIGKGVNKDRNEAIRWYTLAVNSGHKKAIQQLESMKTNEIEEEIVTNTVIEEIKENENN